MLIEGTTCDSTLLVKYEAWTLGATISLVCEQRCDVLVEDDGLSRDDAND